jgi:hypothetical protein
VGDCEAAWGPVEIRRLGAYEAAIGLVVEFRVAASNGDLALGARDGSSGWCVGVFAVHSGKGTVA